MKTQTKIILGVVVVIVVALGWYLISPLFRNIEVNEALPENIDLPESIETETQDQRFEVIGTTGHSASGNVQVLETATGKVIRYEDFSTINGPNLHIYLSKDLEANEYVDLGPIKATQGNINYEVPSDIDISEYRYVMHWCVPFSVLFNYAELK